MIEPCTKTLKQCYFQLKPLATINLPKSPTFVGNFCKGVKINHFSSEIIFGQLLQIFGIFSGHTAYESARAIITFLDMMPAASLNLSSWGNQFGSLGILSQILC